MSGGGMQATASLATLGARIFLIGLILQAISYVLFVMLLITAHHKFSKKGKFSGSEPWWKVVHIL